MKHWAKIVAVNLGLVVLVVIAAELVFGTWFSRDPLDRVNIQRGIQLRLDARGLYPDGPVFIYRRNRWGFRGSDIDPASIDILTIGGSTTNQIYLPQEATWQAAMERRFRQLGHEVVVANAGMEGQSSIGLLYSMEHWFPFVPGLRPRFILAYLGINDSIIGGSTTDRLAFTDLNRWIRYNSAILRLAKTIEGTVRARIERVTHFRMDYANATWTDQPRYSDNRTARPQSDSAAYRVRLSELASRIRAPGSEPVFVTQTRGDFRIENGKVIGVQTESGMNGVDHWRLLDEFNRTTLSACIEERVLCVDAAREIDYEAGDFYDLLHNSPQGAEKIGRFIADRLAPLVESGTARVTQRAGKSR